MQLHLRVLSGNHEGKLIAVNHDKFIVGRSDGCHLRPKSDSISRRHCAILRKDGRVLLVDLKSRNGTLVNDKKLEPAKAKVLKDGDRIQIGKLEFIAVIEPSSASIKVSKPKSASDSRQGGSQSANASDEIVADGAASGDSDSKCEELDVSVWLEEADQFIRSGSEPDTRQFQFTARVSDETILEANAETDTGADAAPGPSVPAKGKPGKLPPRPAKPSAANSKDAASETLRKFFSGGR